MNIVKQLVDQGIKPFYISLESGSRFKRTSLQLGLKDGDFYYNKKWIDPLGIQLEQGSVMIIDWLCPDNFAEVDKIFRHFTEQLSKTNSMLIVFMQLKDDTGAWFSNNLVKQFPALCVRYMYDNENDGTYGKFHIDAIRDPKMFIKTWDIACKYDYSTKILSRIDELEGSEKKSEPIIIEENDIEIENRETTN